MGDSIRPSRVVRQDGGVSGPPPSSVLVRYWASARAAAGVGEETVTTSGPLTLAQLVAEVTTDRPELGRVLAVCSTVIGDRPTGSAERHSVTVAPGDVVEFLPPFAGG